MTSWRTGLGGGSETQKEGEGMKSYTKKETTNFSDSADAVDEEREELRLRARYEAGVGSLCAENESL